MPARERFLVIAAQGLGDSLEATPLVRALRRERPAAQIDVAVTEVTSRLLFAGLPGYVDSVLYFPYWERGLGAFARAVTASRRTHYDLSFLAYPAARPAYQILSIALSARQRIAHRHAPRTLLDLPWLHAALVPVRLVHNVERNRDLLRAAGIAPDDEPRYLVPPSWIAPMSQRHQGRVAVHVGSVAFPGLALRRWPLENFIALSKRLVHEHDEVTLVVGPAEAGESSVVLREVPQLRRFEGTLPEVARFLSTCAVVVANDSGIAHLAAGVGARVVTLLGPTSLECAPFAPNAIPLRPSRCPPCFDVRRRAVRCIRDIDFRCLKRDLTVDLVARSVNDAALARNAYEQ